MAHFRKLSTVKGALRIYISEKELKEIEQDQPVTIIRHWIKLGKERAEKEAFKDQVEGLKQEVSTVREEVERLTHLVAQMGHLMVAMTVKDHQELADVRRKVKSKDANSQDHETSKMYEIKMKNYTDYLSSSFPGLDSSAFIKLSDSQKG